MKMKHTFTRHLNTKRMPKTKLTITYINFVMPTYLQLFERERKKITVDKSGKPNLLVDRTKSMVKLIIFTLPFVVKDEFLKSSVWSRKSRYYLTILLKLFRSVQRSLLYE